MDCRDIPSTLYKDKDDMVGRIRRFFRLRRNRLRNRRQQNVLMVSNQMLFILYLI